MAAEARRMLSADVEDLGLPAEDGGDDLGVAAQAAYGGGGEAARRSR